MAPSGDRGLGAEVASILAKQDDAHHRRAVAVILREPPPTDEAAFFLNLAQQPAGPAVVGSVDKFLVRLEGLRNMTDLPGKDELFHFLAATGLSEATAADARAQVDAAQLETPVPAPQPVTEEELRAADLAQLVAFDRLERWYTLWAGILRQGLSYHMRVRLGVSAVKGGRKAATDPVELPSA